jgi:hypothetical protein
MSGSMFILPGESGDGGDQSIEVLSRERDIPMSASAKATCPQPRSRAREDTMSVPKQSDEGSARWSRCKWQARRCDWSDDDV